jgi:hypothetical protein
MSRVSTGLPASGDAPAAIASLTDSTTGTASDTCNDNTANTKDDLASIIAKVNLILAALRDAGIVKV